MTADDKARLRDAANGFSPLARAAVLKLLDELHAVTAERDRLRSAIADHRAQRADDRCIEDDDRLYAALGDGIKCDRRVGSKAAMLRNCERFIDRRCEGGGWPTYAELEAERDRLRKALEWARLSLKWAASRDPHVDYAVSGGFEAWFREHVDGR